jgi:hypothetical protein
MKSCRALPVLFPKYLENTAVMKLIKLEILVSSMLHYLPLPEKNGCNLFAYRHVILLAGLGCALSQNNAQANPVMEQQIISVAATTTYQRLSTENKSGMQIQPQSKLPQSTGLIGIQIKTPTAAQVDSGAMTEVDSSLNSQENALNVEGIIEADTIIKNEDGTVRLVNQRRSLQPDLGLRQKGSIKMGGIAY